MTLRTVKRRQVWPWRKRRACCRRQAPEGQEPPTPGLIWGRSTSARLRPGNFKQTKSTFMKKKRNWLQTNWLADYQKRRGKSSSGHVDISPEKDGGNRGGQRGGRGRGHVWASRVWDLQRTFGSNVDCSRQQYVIDRGNRHNTTLDVIFLQKLPYIAHCKQIDRSFVLRRYC